jgi:fluoride ion exporter CrcB/FEX
LNKHDFGACGYYVLLTFVYRAGFYIRGVVTLVLGLKFNATFENVPLGTLLANLIGGFIIGFAIAFLPIPIKPKL